MIDRKCLKDCFQVAVGDLTDGIIGDVSVCGNGIVQPGEFCDDGNLTPGDCCDELCGSSLACRRVRRAIRPVATGSITTATARRTLPTPILNRHPEQPGRGRRTSACGVSGVVRVNS